MEVDFWEEDIILPHLSSYTEQTTHLGRVDLAQKGIMLRVFLLVVLE